ncbi:MAG: hypothetical protein IT460_16640 [Planctomycetes bacterium]|nr:hypothetical protein [Planctomycetota bacterium]
MPPPLPTWTDEQFDALCWHDCHVYGWSIVEGEHGTATLTLDLDFIVAGAPRGDGMPNFRVAPATLTFLEVSRLRFEVDYGELGMFPFSIDGICRERRGGAGDDRFRWTIKVNCPSGSLVFDGAGFRQTLRAEPVACEGLALGSARRRALLDADERGPGSDGRARDDGPR